MGTAWMTRWSGLRAPAAAADAGLTAPTAVKVWLGRAVTAARDLNGDGDADAAVGGSGYNHGDSAVGIYLGGTAGLSASPDVSLEDAATDATYSFALSGPGDLDEDQDLVIAAPYASDETGHLYIYAGAEEGPSTDPEAVVEGPRTARRSASTSAGDVNGDGYDDLAIGASTDEEYVYYGAVHVYHGSASGLSTTAALTLEETSSAAYDGAFGDSLASRSDIDGDGSADLVVGEPEYSRAHGGRVHPRCR